MEPTELPSTFTKTCYFVTGAENSGNKMLVQALCSAGCYGNPHQNELVTDDLDFHLLPPNITKIALARSVPHGNVYPDPRPIAKLLQLAHFNIVPIYVYRKTDYVIVSQIKRGYADTHKQAIDNINRAAYLAYEFASWLTTKLIVVNYELFVLHPYIQGHLFHQIGLPAPTTTLFNANEGHVIDAPVLPI